MFCFFLLYITLIYFARIHAYFIITVVDERYSCVNEIFYILIKVGAEKFTILMQVNADVLNLKI